MEIRVHIPKPLLTISAIVVLFLWWNGVIVLRWPGAQADTDLSAEGGQETAALITEAIKDIDRERVTQAVLERREEILRYQLQTLENAALNEKSPEALEKLNETRAVLISIIKERATSEKLLKLSLEQLWAAQGTAYSMEHRVITTELDWPVDPALGISAHFQDAGYKKRFGVDHHAIDIPVAQGTAIRTPADGTVLKVSLNGLGYSYIVIDHGKGLESVYGHVTDATVEEGDLLSFGQVIGHTGGQPGTMGAGLLTTGPHLHFAVKVDGALVDPLKYLPMLGEAQE